MNLNARHNPIVMGGSPFRQPGFLREIVLTLASAVLTGLSASLLLILLVFGWTSAQAAADEGPTHGMLSLRALDGRELPPAPLLSTAVTMQVDGLLARVRVEQQFSNPTAQWLEGIYQFPLPPDSAVYRLRMVIGERVIEGRIEEKQRAEQVYRQAKASGRRASLLSQQRPNIFTTALANIAPGEQIRVVIEYQEVVRYADHRFELRFPLVVGPRYIPGVPLAEAGTPPGADTGWAADTDQVPDASRITPPVLDPAAGKRNPVSIEIVLDAGFPLAEVKSYYHPLVREHEENGVVHLRLAEGEVPADRDFLLSWQPAVGMQPRAAIFRQSWHGEDYALLMVMPPDQEGEAQRLPREMIFVVDNSGSMHGASITQAKAALRLALSRLQPEDRFNLIRFNDDTESLFGQAQPASQDNLGQAMAFLDSLQAEGGTEMMPALRLALETGHGDDRHPLRQVVFLTDGSVGNESALFELIRQRLGESRLFTVGIGSAPNSHFMQRAADFGRGTFTYIGDLNEVQSRMQTLFAKLEHPAMSDLRLQREGDGPLDVLPSRIPDLYLGEPLVLALKGARIEDGMVLEGVRDGTPWRHRLAPPTRESRVDLHRFWARQRIRELMAQSLNGEASQARRQAVIQLALEHQLVSPYTSLIAVERTPVRPATAPLKGGPVPLNLPAGWSAKHVFGSLPQTATAAPLSLLLGFLLLLASLWLWRRRSA
ncbi:MAG: marine proteobacterial sortase target protein [Candidatus Thiodiazotropha sp.]